MSLVEDLGQFGLDSKKAKIYLASLELGTAKAFAIAKKAKIERPTTYDILDKLTTNGLISSYEKRGVKYYVAEDPENIKKQLAEKERAIDSLLPDLRSIYNTLKAKPKIKYYDGVEGIKTIFEDTLTAQGKQLRGILSVVDLFDIPGRKFMDSYVNRRIHNKVSLRVIRSRPKEIKEYWPTDPAALRKLRYSQEKTIFSMTMYVYDNKVSLISSKNESFGMIIESDELSENMGHLFEALWQMSESDKLV